MIPTPPDPPTPINVIDLKTGRPLDAQLLSEAEAREIRRRRRRVQRTEQERALRILNTALRQAGRGQLERAGHTVMRNFGAMILSKLFGKGDGT